MTEGTHAPLVTLEVRRPAALTRAMELLAPLTGGAIALVMFAVYWWIGPSQASSDPYLPLAQAWLHGRANLDPHVYTWLELAPSHGQWYVPFPPTATLVVLPFVAIFGQ